MSKLSLTVKVEVKIVTSSTLGWSGEYNKDGSETLRPSWRASAFLMGKEIATTVFGCHYDTESKAIAAIKKTIKEMEFK